MEQQLNERIIDMIGFKSYDSNIQKNNGFIRALPINLVKDEIFIESVPETKHAAEALKDINDVVKVSECLLAKKDYRSNLLFIMGINFGLRAGDLLRIRIGDILKSGNEFKQIIKIEEEKTDKFEEGISEDGSTVKLKKKKGNIRTCYMNDAVMDAAILYFNSLTGKDVSLNSYLFSSKSNNNSSIYYDKLRSVGKLPKRNVDSSLTVFSVSRILKKVINEELKININASSHMLRKTFAYHVLMNAPDRTRALEMLQITLGHRSIASTLHYIGITQDEIMETCRNLNLGSNDKSKALADNICYAAGVSTAV